MSLVAPSARAADASPTDGARLAHAPAPGAPLWTSATLASAIHTFKLRVDATKNPNSSGFTIAVDRVDLL